MTRLPLKSIFILAWRNLWRNHRRTVVMLAAITVGAWAMIFMTALMRGMVDDMLLNGIRDLPAKYKFITPTTVMTPVLTTALMRLVSSL